MATGMMRIHTDPEPVLREYECDFSLGCDYTTWSEMTNPTCPRHRRRLTAVKEGT
jgi:hypothetical protein